MIYSYLRKLQRPQDIALKHWVDNHKSYIIIPYSTALLSDLANGYDDDNESIRTETRKDLELISELTENKCLYSELNDPNPLWALNNPVDLFENYKPRKQTKS